MAKLFLVGGAVRDKIMGKESKDLDFVVEGPQSMDELLSFLESRGIRVLHTKPQFLTVIGFDPEIKQRVDFVLPRTDGDYSDGRRPNSTAVGTLFEDLSRRDFTMNAIAQDWDTKELFDPFKGLEHIREGRIVAVGNASDRFREDSLRMLRALRFSVTKNMRLDRDVEMLMFDSEFVNLLRNVSVERVAEELRRMLQHDWVKTIRLLEGFSLWERLSHTFPRLWLEPTLKVR